MMTCAKRATIVGSAFAAALLFLAIKYELPEYFHHGSEQEHLSGAYQALNFFSFQRAYPNNSIPDVSHYAAFEYSRNMFDNSNKTNFDTDPWHTIGPHNLGGRTLAVAFNPQNPNSSSSDPNVGFAADPEDSLHEGPVRLDDDPFLGTDLHDLAVHVRVHLHGARRRIDCWRRSVRSRGWRRASSPPPSSTPPTVISTS